MPTDSPATPPRKALIDRNEFLDITREGHRVMPKDVLGIWADSNGSWMVDIGKERFRFLRLDKVQLKDGTTEYRLPNGMDVFKAFESIGFAKFEGLDDGNIILHGANKQRKICAVNPLKVQNMDPDKLLLDDPDFNRLIKAVISLDAGNTRKFTNCIMTREHFRDVAQLIDTKKHEMKLQIRREEMEEERRIQQALASEQQQSQGGGGGGQMTGWADRTEQDGTPNKIRQQEISLLDRVKSRGKRGAEIT